MNSKDPKWALALLYPLLAASITMAAYVLYDLDATKKTLLNTFMQRPLESIGHQLEGFFRPVTQLSDMAVEQAASGLFNIRDTASVNRYFMPLLRSYDQITSIGVADTTGYEYDILLTDSEWRSRTVRPDAVDGSNHWGCWNMTMDSCLGIWTEPMRQDPRTRPWYTGAMGTPGQHYWTGPYLFNTDSLFGVTLSTSFQSKEGVGIVALDVTLQRLSAFMAQIRLGQRGGAFLLTRDLEPISLQSNDTDPFVRAAKEIIATFGQRAEGSELNTDLNVTVDDERWYGRMRRYDLDSSNHLYAVVVMPEAEMMTEVNRTTNVILFSIALSTLFTLLLFLLLHQLRSANAKMVASAQQIAKQNRIIKDRNREVQESFNYAQRIQQIMLPEMNALAKMTMSNIMTVYLPKDTVSGDFYWGKFRGGISYFAAADCTGHGVPGAMMSILGIDLLNASVGKDNSSLPENLLYQLRHVLIRRMTSGSTIARDGMDIGLCRLDHQTKILQFAGAFIPLILVRTRALGNCLEVITDGRHHELEPTASSATHHLYVIKGNRMPIGFVDHREHVMFTGHQIQLQPSDSVYMMSDGYADQFGGPDDRKFGQRNLRQTLLDLEPLSIIARKDKLEAVLRDHMGERQQVDDICILGFICTEPTVDP